MEKLTKEYKALVRESWKLFTQSQRVWSKAFSDVGLSSATFPVVELAVQKPGISQQEIADALCVDKSCVSRAVKSLVENGFLQREKSVDHTHGFSCMPTEKSRKAYEQVIRQEEEQIRTLFEQTDVENLLERKEWMTALNATLAAQLQDGQK